MSSLVSSLLCTFHYTSFSVAPWWSNELQLYLCNNQLGAYLHSVGTARYSDYGLRTTVGRKLSCCVALGRVHNEWRENRRLHTPDYDQVFRIKILPLASVVLICIQNVYFQVQNVLVYSLAHESIVRRRNCTFV